LKRIWVSVDVELDIQEHIVGSSRGIEEGLPRILDLFDDLSIRADFFVLGKVAREYPDLVERISSRGHEVGSHGDSHRVLCTKSLEFQRAEIRRSIQSISGLTKKPVRIFRAPNFSANGDTIQVLEELGIAWDSSVLPGRMLLRWRLQKAYDHRGAPRTIYNPSVASIDRVGASSVLELPVTENPLQPGTPIGLGFLNSHSVEESIQAVENAIGDYASFLIHPWEAVDLATGRRDLPNWLARACSPDLSALQTFLAKIGERADFINATSIGIPTAV